MNDHYLDHLRREKLDQAISIPKALHFGPRQSNEVAGYTLLTLADLRPDQKWSEATAPLRGIKGIIDFMREYYNVSYAPNTRETIRDEAVEYFVSTGLLLTNPDNPNWPTNSGKYVYQITNETLQLLKNFNTEQWNNTSKIYLEQIEPIRQELTRMRKAADISLTFS
ncbi:hypothetical protein [uncultured Chloroflexus sp.]|uniref:hypothetical protein n=1 Tax=uncultured Chloroflexus sp. TaxID=214040 RepID=UPI0026042EF1|nr:hypothetical protein [uncultured Chloroflexus sp.]